MIRCSYSIQVKHIKKTFDINCISYFSKTNIMIRRRVKMPINQIELNNLLSVLQPKDTLTELKKHRDNLLKQLTQQTTTDSDILKPYSVHIDTKQIITDLQSTNIALQQSLYEVVNNKLENERLDREKAAAKLMYQSEKSLAAHERILTTASRKKMSSALSKIAVCWNRAQSGISPATFLENSNQNNPIDVSQNMNNEIDQDIKQSVELNTAANDVARRQKHIKKAAEEAVQNNTTPLHSADSKQKKNKSIINITA